MLIVDLFIQLLLALQNGSVTEQRKSLQIGKFLRRCKEHWIYVMYLVKTVCSIHYTQIDMQTIDNLQSFIVTNSKLIDCWKWRPLMNGKQLMEKYKVYGLGPDARLGKLNQFILEQRLSNPGTTTIDDIDGKIIEWLQQNPAEPRRSKKKSKKKIKIKK